MDTTLPQPRRWPRRLWFVALAVLPHIIVRLLMMLASQSEMLQSNNFALMMGLQFSLFLGILALIVWFFLLSGLSSRTRLIAGGLLLGAILAFFSTVKKIEYDGQMTPRPRYRWEPDPEQLLAEHRAIAPKATATADLTVQPSDSPMFRGEMGLGRTPNVKLADDWTKTPPKILWEHPAGAGHAGFAVAGNSAITIEQFGDDEAIVCYDRATGNERWKYAYQARFDHSEPMGGAGPRATPSIHQGLVVSLGAQGDLVCLNGADGQLRWRLNIITDNDAANIEWGMSGSPLILNDMVIVNPGSKLGEGPSAVVAYHLTTGKKRWTAPGGIAAYASPMMAVINGMPKVLVFDALGLRVIDPREGV
ncbi:MAG: PQQ-binding-like beta-propeller repeat protein, partial [Gemmataceae bacterium]